MRDVFEMRSQCAAHGSVARNLCDPLAFEPIEAGLRCE